MADRETDAIMDEIIYRLKTEIAIADYHGKHRIEINVELLRKTLGYLEEQQEQIDKLIEESASNAEMAEGLKELLKEQEERIETLESLKRIEQEGR